MDKADLIALITTRNHKLKALREQAANGNEEKKKLYMASLLYLIEEKRTQPQAYQQITELLSTGSEFIANAVDKELVPSLLSFHTQTSLDDYIILWGRMCDGSLAKKQYPDFRERFERLKIKNSEKQLGPVFKNYLLQFEKNFNQRHDERVEFFEDFDDSVISESMDNQSQLMNVLYLSIMQVKAARKKLEERLSDEALNEQLTKIKHFLSLKVPGFLSEFEREEFQKQRRWAREYLMTKQEEKRKNPSVSLNETLVIQGEEEQIEVVKNDPKPRMFKSKNPLSRQFFEDSMEFSDKKGQQLKLKAGKPHYQSFPTPVKLIDPRYEPSDPQQLHHSLQIHNENPSLGLANLRPLIEQYKEEDSIQQELIVHKIKPGETDPTKAKPVPDFSVTENYFKKGSQHEVMSPRGGAYSRTEAAWGQSGQLTPSKYSRCKLSKFTSQKKARKQSAPRNQLQMAETHVIQPYLQHFSNIGDYARFRRNCFQSNYTLYLSDLLTVVCTVAKEANSKVCLQMKFVNGFYLPLELEVVYKVPQCFQIEKKTKIAKRFKLHNNMTHAFCLGALQFPLEPCLISLKVKSLEHQAVEEGIVPFSLTFLNFVEYLCVSEQEWGKEWASINAKEGQQFYFFSKHIQIDRNVVGDQIDWLLRDHFIRLTAIQGYSVQDYGCVCFYPALQNLRFMVHFSVRVDNIVSLQASSCRLVTKDERQFIDYCMNLWMMLLGKLYI